jgi:hypothetical protein
MEPIEELEFRLKALALGHDPLVLRRGPRNESLDAIGRVDLNPDSPPDLGGTALVCAMLVGEVSACGRTTYWSMGCNANAMTYSVTFSLLPPPKTAEGKP